jgi:hypothetical protein
MLHLDFMEVFMSGRKVRLNVGYVSDGSRQTAGNGDIAVGVIECGNNPAGVDAGINGSSNRKATAVSSGDLYSSRMEMLSSRASVLNGKDRALMRMYLKSGSTFRQLARLAGTNEATVARRISKLISRLVNAEYIICLRNREIFEKIEIAIARDFFISGISIKKIAFKRDVSIYIVRKALLKVQQVAKENG